MTQRSESVLRARFSSGAGAPSAARRFVRRAMSRWSSGEPVEDAVLLTSELVTNAVIHTGSAIEVACRLDVSAESSAVVVEVEDSDPTRLVLPADLAVDIGPDANPGANPDMEQLTGRGLVLTGMVADAWGVAYTRAAKRVWFRLELTRPPANPEIGVSAPVRPAVPVNPGGPRGR